MGNRLGIVGILFLIIFIMACNEVVPEPFVPNLQANTQKFDFDSTGGDRVLIIASNTNWTIMHDAGWCRPSIGADSGDVTLYINADPNDSTFVRNTIFKLMAEGVDDLEISIEQTGKAEVIVEDPVVPVEDPEMRNLTSLEVSKLMGVGWNLGNSLEAISANNGNYSGGETTWGNPKVSQLLIDSIKAAGFNAIRIPVSWSHKIVDQYSYEINEAWLERVAEVVNYVLDNQMYAIINIHWDGGWMDHPDNAHQNEINEKLEALWSQIAAHFVNYNDHLLFAGSNEVHMENNWGTPTTENVNVQNSFNQTFVDAVRATGGRNALRHLVVQGYVTNIDNTLKYFKVPIDPAENRLMVEVHFYDPYDFTLQEGSGYKTQWGKPFAGGNVSTWGQESWVNDVFGKMKTKFVNNGMPVILGEYGAMLRSSLTTGLDKHVEARNYYIEYVTKAAVDNGMVPFYWDNGHTGNNGFGLFNRSTGKQVYPETIRAIVKAVE